MHTKPTPPVLIDSYTGEYAYKDRIVQAHEVPACREDYERELDQYNDYMDARREDWAMEREFTS